MHRHATETAGDLLVDDLLGMSPAAIGRVQVLWGDYHATADSDQRRAIRQQLRAFVAELDPDLNRPFTRDLSQRTKLGPEPCG